MEDDQDNWWAGDKEVQSTPAPASSDFSVRPLGTGTKQPAPQTTAQAELDRLRVENERLEKEKREREAAKASGEKGPQEMARAQDEILNVVRNAVKAKQMGQEGWFATGFGSDIAGMIPGTTAYTMEHGPLSTIGANAAFDRLSRMRAESPTGGALGNVTEQELELLRNSVASLNRGVSDEEFQANMDRIIEVYGNTFRNLKGDEAKLREAMGELPQLAAGASSAPGAPPPDQGSGLDMPEGPGVAQITTGPVKYATETDRRYATILQTVLDRKGSLDEANKVAAEFGYPPIPAAQWNSALATKKRGGAVRIGVPESGVKQPSPDAKAAASPLGAAVIGAANAATAGFSDELYGALDSMRTGQPMDQAIAEANFRKGLVQNANPGAYLAGEIAGGVGTQFGAGALMGGGLKGAVRAFSPKAMAGDVAYGGAYGAGENNEDRFAGGVAGAVGGLGGGIGGRGLANTVAGTIAPRVNPMIRALRDRGVRLSPGQAMGETASKFEEKLGSLPVVGDMIRGTRERSIEDFNRAVVDDALAPIGKKLPEGTETTAAMKFAQNAFDDAYADARAGMQLRTDAQMITELQGLEQRVAQGGLDEDAAKRLRKIYDAQVGRRIRSGTVSGDEYKRMASGLGKLQRTTRASNYELSAAIGELKDIVDSAARRSSPPDAIAKLDAADQGYALFIRAEEAAKRRGGETGAFTPLQYDAAVQAGDFSARSKAYLRGEAMGQELAEAGKQVLRDRIPNSGTPERLAALGGIGGAGYMNPALLAIPGGLAAAYAPGVRTAVPAFLTRKSGPAATAVADTIRNRGRVLGSGLANLALIYSSQQ